jgi:hypothetical protein
VLAVKYRANNRFLINVIGRSGVGVVAGRYQAISVGPWLCSVFVDALKASSATIRGNLALISGGRALTGAWLAAGPFAIAD